jgi:uncharacterized membrane protein
MRWLVIFSVLLAFSLGSPAVAQTTGGSFGGGSFGGGGGGGGGYSGGGGGGSYGGVSTYHRRGAGGGCEDGTVASAALFMVGGFVLFFMMAWAGPASSTHETPRLSPTHSLVDVTGISLAIDWRERDKLQQKLRALADEGDTSTPGGLARLLHETVIALRRVETSWLYAGAVNHQPMPLRHAEREFRTIASEMRSRFRQELVRNADGTTRTEEASPLKARAEEGPGVVVVTLVVAAHGHIPDVAHAQNAAHLHELMRALGGIGAMNLVALEVIWSPAAEEDRMSTAELEVLYPELRRIDEATFVGRVFCDYCDYPYAAELGKCPQCGAPAKA